MSGAIAAVLLASSSELKRTTITVGDDGVSTSGYISGLYGSIASGTFSDATGNSRTIILCTWTGSNIQLWFSVASVPNTAATFNSITLTGPGGSVSLSRSAATYNASAGGGTRTSWLWANSTFPGTTSQTVTLVVKA